MHGAELAFVLGSGNEGWLDIYGPSRIPRGLRASMMDAWLAFARSGNPNHANLATWPAYETAGRPTMIFDAAGSGPNAVVVNDPDGTERMFWEGVPFDGVTPTSLPTDL